MIFLVVIELIWFIIVLILGDTFDAPGAPDPPDSSESTLNDILKNTELKDKHKVRFVNPDYDPEKEFDFYENNPYIYPFRNDEEDKPKKVPKQDFFKKKVTILLFFGVCCVLVSGIPIILSTSA